MPSLISRIAGLLMLFGSYCCARWMIAVWHWVAQNGHTEGSPAGLDVFAIGIGVDFMLLIAGAMLAIAGVVALLFPWKSLLGRGAR